jgi:hypothetical protein
MVLLVSHSNAVPDLLMRRSPTITTIAAAEFEWLPIVANGRFCNLRYGQEAVMTLASKLLLRHGLVYSGCHAWTDARHTRLHRQRVDDPALQAAYSYEASPETAELTLDRRNRLGRQDQRTGANGPVCPRGQPAGDVDTG